MLDLFAQILLQQKKDWGANMLQVLIFVFVGLLFVQVYWL
jgi:hypothetical protein